MLRIRFTPTRTFQKQHLVKKKKSDLLKDCLASATSPTPVTALKRLVKTRAVFYKSISSSQRCSLIKRIPGNRLTSRSIAFKRCLNLPWQQSGALWRPPWFVSRYPRAPRVPLQNHDTLCQPSTPAPPHEEQEPKTHPRCTRYLYWN